MWFPIDVQYVYLAPTRCYGLLNVMILHMTLTIMSRSYLTSLMDSSDVVSYWCLIHFICLSCSNKVLQATEMWWYCVWPWPLGQGQIWNHQWIPQMWFPINVLYISYVYLAPIRCYRLLLLFSMYFLWGAIWPWFDLLEILVTYFSSYICRS